MSKLENRGEIYMIGIGGIGMSALARYFRAGGFSVSGYDRSRSPLTSELEKEGCSIVYIDDHELIPRPARNRDETLVIYTPAIPADCSILGWFRENGFRIHKRAEVLGWISERSNTIAIAGTHGKTSISTLTAHLLKQSSIDCSAFLGGISKNYNSNLITGASDMVVIEADEYDRSFHNLKPLFALISSMDADHLDVYGNRENMVEAFNRFAGGIREEGTLVVNSRVRSQISHPGRQSIYTYGFDEKSDFRISKLQIKKFAYHFNAITPFGEIPDLVSLSPGRLSLENCIAAISMATLAGVKDDEIRKALIHFKGVKRRFDTRFDNGKTIYIDDYAHHPVELDYFINSVKEFYGNRRITLIFQPHLFSRTADHAEAFARSLDVADRIILLPVYPAREKALPGVTSELIFNRLTRAEKYMMDKEEVIQFLNENEIEVLLTVGAGDIDTLAEPIVELLKSTGR